jgi:hypothetical protein
MLLVFIVAGVVFIVTIIRTLDAFGLAVYWREICAVQYMEVQYMEADIFVSAIIELHIINFTIVIGITTGINVVDGAGVCGSIFLFFANCFGDTGGDITRGKTFECAIVGSIIVAFMMAVLAIIGGEFAVCDTVEGAVVRVVIAMFMNSISE